MLVDRQNNKHEETIMSAITHSLQPLIASGLGGNCRQENIILHLSIYYEEIVNCALRLLLLWIGSRDNTTDKTKVIKTCNCNLLTSGEYNM